MTWPVGTLVVDVSGLLVEARTLDAAIAAGQPCSPAVQGAAMALTDALAAYVAGLPEREQAFTAKKLVTVLSARPRFTPTVAPRSR